MSHDNSQSLIRALEEELADCAAYWRLDQTDANVRKYHAVYNRLVSLGWDQSLDIESHLPTGLMPQAYHDLRARSR